MKKIFVLFTIILGWTCSAGAQTIEEQYKQQTQERREMMSLTEKALNAKCAKLAKKNAKRDKKEGWKPLPGEQSLEIQYDEKLHKDFMMNGESGIPVYIVGSGSGVSVDMQMAYDMAKARAVSDIAEHFKIEFDQVIDESNNNQQTDTEIHLLKKYISESTQYVTQNLRSIHHIVKMYHERGDGKYEVRVYSCVDFDQAKYLLFEKMELENSELRDRLNSLIERRKK